MSIQAVAWALEQALPGKAKLVLISIANHADHTNGYCWLKIETIAREASTPERSLYRYIGALVRNGYLRREKKKGADGKQRANDYWVLLGRPESAWDWGAVISGDEDHEPQDDVEPTATQASGQSELADGDDEEKTPDLAPGPTANGGSLYSDEPSKTNPSKREDARESGRHTPRAYRPPPPQPMGAIIADKDAKQIFVFEGTRAWEAWKDFKSRERGIDWDLTTTHLVDGKSRRGWWFPSLFPPSITSTGPPLQPKRSLMTEADHVYADTHGI